MAEKNVVLTVVNTETTVAEELIETWARPEDHVLAQARRSLSARYNVLAGRACLRAILYHCSGVRSWTVVADERGKISASSPAVEVAPAISLSHSGQEIACAAALVKKLGIDVERHRVRPYSAIAEYAFGAKERHAVAEGGEKAFYRLWTLREAFGKAMGDGLALAADGRDRFADGPPQGLWHQSLDGRVWLFGHYEAKSDLSTSIAAQLCDGDNPKDWTLSWLDPASLAEGFR